MQIDDADGILGTHGEPNTMNLTFDAAGKNKAACSKVERLFIAAQTLRNGLGLAFLFAIRTNHQDASEQ